MKILRTVGEMVEALGGGEERGGREENIGFVPTMGALHSGHLELVRRAKRECGIVVVSVFVNPTQFNDKGDLERYPRDLERDAGLLESVGADLLFSPTVGEVYPNGTDYTITDPMLLSLTGVMEGAHRPGHFDGVVQVVGRLFDIVNPDKAYFGLKDFQQLAVIRMMTEVQKREVDIVPCEIVRDTDGLALSSRNALLSTEERAAAPNIYRVLQEVRRAVDGGVGEIDAIKKSAVLEINKNPYLCAEYLEVVDARTLQSVAVRGKKLRICTAVRCGVSGVRLIDNI